MDSKNDQDNFNSMLKELELGDEKLPGSNRNLRTEFMSFLKIRTDLFQKVGFRMSVVIGMSGDWQLSLEFVSRLVDLGDDSRDVKLWQLRCLVELERYAEAIALSSAVKWLSTDMIHVNFMTALSYDALGMKEQARIRFDAVRAIDSTYRNIAQKLSKY